MKSTSVSDKASPIKIIIIIIIIIYIMLLVSTAAAVLKIELFVMLLIAKDRCSWWQLMVLISDGEGDSTRRYSCYFRSDSDDANDAHHEGNGWN